MSRYLIWDFDGTLAYREGGWTGTLLELLQATLPDHTCTAEQLRPHLRAGFPWHHPDRAHPVLPAEAWWDALDPLFVDAFRSAGLPLPLAEHLARQVRHTYPHTSRWRLFPDTIPALRALAAQGWTHLVLSNHCPQLPTIVAGLNLSAYIARIFNSADTGYEKPHPEAFRHVRATFDPGATVYMIGDNPEADIRGAQAVDIPGLLVRNQAPRILCCPDLGAVTTCLNEIADG